MPDIYVYYYMFCNSLLLLHYEIIKFQLAANESDTTGIRLNTLAAHFGILKANMKIKWRNIETSFFFFKVEVVFTSLEGLCNSYSWLTAIIWL